MSEAAPRIGVLDVPGGAESERLASAVDAAGGRPVVGSPADVLDTDRAGDRAGHETDLVAVAASGSKAVRAIARRRSTTPLLPVDVDCGLPSVALDDVESALAGVVTGTADAVSTPLLSVAADGTSTTAFREVTAITAEPARISEFAIEHDRVGPVDTVRADGVVTATPAGSHGYAAAGDGPLLAPGTGLAVVPVAPFRTDRSRWVVPLDGVTVRVQRDEAAVTVEADGDVLATIGRDAEVTIAPAGDLDVLVVEGSRRGSR